MRKLQFHASKLTQNPTRYVYIYLQYIPGTEDRVPSAHQQQMKIFHSAQEFFPCCNQHIVRANNQALKFLNLMIVIGLSQ